MKRTPFTLLELVAVIMVMALATSMAVAVFKGNSPAKRLEDASLQWEEFCARVRFQSLETGEERQIIFDPEKRCFSMKVPSGNMQNHDSEEEEIKRVAEIKWELPKDFEIGGDFLNGAENPEEDGSFEMFRFYSDGSASGKRKLELSIGGLSNTFEISMLTGRMIRKEQEKQ
ncbi:MAG: hypothetical protein J6W81_09270 [Lentisphaeria bacterium]|nr:hypothetical protein [Lentisphaeria bacterium]